jgi:hypothetical protein
MRAMLLQGERDFEFIHEQYKELQARGGEELEYFVRLGKAATLSQRGRVINTHSGERNLNMLRLVRVTIQKCAVELC